MAQPNTKFVPSRKGVIKALIFILIGVALLVWSLILERGILTLGPGFVLILGACCSLYGVLLLTLMAMVKWKMKLTGEEIFRYGKQLEEATPLILDLIEKGLPASQVAQAVEQSKSVPVHVTLRYIIELGKYAREHNLDHHSNQQDSRGIADS